MKYIRYILLILAPITLFVGCSCGGAQPQPSQPDKKLCKVVIDEPSDEELAKFNKKCTVPKWR
jgi:hypothetical protein